MSSEALSATAVIAAIPDLAAQLTAEDHRILTDAADHGHTEAVRLAQPRGRRRIARTRNPRQASLGPGSHPDC